MTSHQMIPDAGVDWVPAAVVMSGSVRGSWQGNSPSHVEGQLVPKGPSKCVNCLEVISLADAANSHCL